MKYPKVKKKQKFKRICYNCKYFSAKCVDRFSTNAVNCDKFKFSALCKSILRERSKRII